MSTLFAFPPPSLHIFPSLPRGWLAVSRLLYLDALAEFCLTPPSAAGPTLTSGSLARWQKGRRARTSPVPARRQPNKYKASTRLLCLGYFLGTIDHCFYPQEGKGLSFIIQLPSAFPEDPPSRAEVPSFLGGRFHHFPT